MNEDFAVAVQLAVVVAMQAAATRIDSWTDLQARTSRPGRAPAAEEEEELAKEAQRRSKRLPS